jgi:hypothetical protein
MSYLFIKNLFQRERFVQYYFHKKLRILNKKKQKKNVFSVFFGFFWVGFFYRQPCLDALHALRAVQVGQVERQASKAVRHALLIEDFGQCFGSGFHQVNGSVPDLNPDPRGQNDRQK